MSHNGVHQAFLIANLGDNGTMRHLYRRCPQSGAGNCCCGRVDSSPIHAVGVSS